MPEHLTPTLNTLSTAQAWEVDLTNLPPSDAATVALWIVEAPGYTPAWDKYAVSIVHLRPAPDVPPAELDGPDATHQVNIAALDPDHPVTAEAVAGGARLHMLRPINLSTQVRNGTDEEMVTLARLMARSIVESLMPPEPAFSAGPGSEFQEAWCVAIDHTLSHLRTGAVAHPNTVLAATYRGTEG